jgi:ABC-2 type transport system permease protein
MIPIIRFEVSRRKWSVFWWSFGVMALIVLTLAFYPTIKGQTSELNKSFGDLSPQLTSLFSDTGEFFSPVGYLSSQIFYLVLPLLLSMLAIGMGASLLTKDELDHTLELTLARPISRSRVLLSKAFAGLLVLAIVGFVSLVTNIVMAKLVHIDVGLANIAFTNTMAVLLAAMFGSLAFALSAYGRFARLASIGITAMVALLGYITTSFVSYVHWMIWPARLLPYHYYSPAGMLEGHLTWDVMLWFIVVIIVLGILAIIGFRRRDIA